MIFVNEERKKLFDNGILTQEDLNLSLGIVLSKEQINSLKSDILQTQQIYLILVQILMEVKEMEKKNGQINKHH